MKIALWLILFSFCRFFLVAAEVFEDSLEAAYTSYRQGEEAKTLVERQKAFNQALLLYLKASQQGSSAMLNYNIGNSFYQLEEYPWAILYYNRALMQKPNDAIVKHNLTLAEKQLGLPSTLTDSYFKSIIVYFNQFIILPDQLFLFFLLGMLSLLIASCFLWFQYKWLKDLAFSSIGLSAIVLTISLISQYGIPVEGIVISTTHMYRNAGREYPLVFDAPIWAGTKVRILNVVDHGQWLKIVIADGNWGYIPYESIRLI